MISGVHLGIMLYLQLLCSILREVTSDGNIATTSFLKMNVTAEIYCIKSDCTGVPDKVAT